MPQVIRATTERRPVLGTGERFPTGLVPDLVVAGVLQDAAPGGLEDPPVEGRAEPLYMRAEQPDQDRGDGDGPGLVIGAVLQAAFLPGGALVSPGPRAAAGGAVVAARLFTVAGEGQRPDMALSRWIADVAADRPARVFGSLLRTRDITDVRDVCTAVLALAEHEASGVVNVGTGVAHTLGEMLAAVGAALGRTVTVDLQPVEHDDPNATLADPARLFELTGQRPYTDLPSLVRRQAAAALGQP